MLEKFGSELYVTSQHFKDKMLEKYGNECYLNSQHFRDYLFNKYGVYHIMHVPEFFHKMIKSNFTRKEYIFKIDI